MAKFDFVKFKFDNYKEMLEQLSSGAMAASYVAGADDVGAFCPIRKIGEGVTYGQFSSLREYLEDFADVLNEWLTTDEGEEMETWDC